jgi:DNA-binding CsgD family transcriptional regulator
MDGQVPVEELTKQEKKVLLLTMQGFSSKQIAVKLQLSQNTISNHRKNMLRKTRCKNIAHLVCVAIKDGLVEI